MFGMSDVWNVECSGCGMLGCEMFETWDVWDVICSGCGMLGMCDV